MRKLKSRTGSWWDSHNRKSIKDKDASSSIEETIGKIHRGDSRFNTQQNMLPLNVPLRHKDRFEWRPLRRSRYKKSSLSSSYLSKGRTWICKHVSTPPPPFKKGQKLITRDKLMTPISSERWHQRSLHTNYVNTSPYLPLVSSHICYLTNSKSFYSVLRLL